MGHRKKEDPAHQLPTITNQSPKVKTAKQAPPMWRRDDGGGKENINIKVPHSPLHKEMRELEFADIKTSFHISILSPQPIGGGGGV